MVIVSSVPQDARLIAMARNINDSKPDWVVEKVKLAIAEILISDPSKSVCDLKIACYGLAFKSNIDDLRESPALLVANKVIDMHAGMVMLVEPNICQLPQSYHGKLLVDFDVASSSADIHVLLVDHDGFKGNVPSSGQIIDTRGIWK
jgi:UDP-N-acetyl-D-mannosaminuronic acid dehydrogenase